MKIHNQWKWTPLPRWMRDPTESTTLAPGYFGIAADWNVPAEAYDNNIGGYDDILHMAWLTSDSAGFENYYGAILWLAGAKTKGSTGDTTIYSAPFGTHVLTNMAQLYLQDGYDDDSLYKYMSTPGYSIESDSSQDMNIVMSFVEELNPDSTTVIDMEYALIVTDEGLSDLYEQASLIREVDAGDANADGTVSVSDVVYLVNYLFKGGSEPFLAYSDANGDETVSVSDVVYLINYLFKGGPAPVLVWDVDLPW